MPATRHYGFTDTGRVRAHNEDAFLADSGLGLFVVCDGVGGRARGEIASQETVEFILDWIKSDTTDIEIARTRALDEPGVQRLGALVRGAVQNACYMVHSMGEMDPERRGMSTTASVALVAAGVAIVGWVGDSRVYLARGAEISQITDDHTLVNYQVKQGVLTADQARRSKMKHVITRAVGHRDFVEVDIRTVPLQHGDKLLLCSDGLHEYLDASATLQELFAMDVQKAAREAIRHANDQGGRDNITALFVEYLGPGVAAAPGAVTPGTPGAGTPGGGSHEQGGAA
jgi:serine/threonine protein phosphatase PrpC